MGECGLDDRADEDELLSLIEDSASAFLGEKHRPERLRQNPLPSLWPDLGELGLLGINLPETDGGSGLGAVGVTRIARLFGRELLPDPFIAHAVIPASLIGALPVGEARTALAAALLEGSRSMTLAWQEDAGQLCSKACAATMASGAFSGEKIAVSYADMVLITVRTDQGIALVQALAPPETTPTRTLAGAAFGQLDLSSLTQTGSPLLVGDAAVRAVDRAIGLGVLAVAAQLCGIADGAFALTLAHLKTRRQFGKAIGDFQALQHRAVDLLMAIALAEASVAEAARCWDEDPDSETTAAAVSAAKARSGATAVLVSREAIQMHGAMGFTEEASVGLYVRAAHSLNGWLGSPRHHRRRFVSLGTSHV